MLMAWMPLSPRRSLLAEAPRRSHTAGIFFALNQRWLVMAMRDRVDLDHWNQWKILSSAVTSVMRPPSPPRPPHNHTKAFNLLSVRITVLLSWPTS